MRDKLKRMVVVIILALIVSALLYFGVDRLVNSPFRPPLVYVDKFSGPALYPSVLILGTVVMCIAFYVEIGVVAAMMFFIGSVLVTGDLAYAWKYDYPGWQIFLGLFFFFSTVFAIIAQKIE